MRINEILTESHLEEGPLLNKIGAGVGKAAGTVAKGVGAVAGGVAGAWDAAKKGFQAGKQQVAGAGDEDPNAQAAPTTAAGINAQGPKGTAAAKAQTGAAATAINKTAQATAGASPEQAGQTLYAQVKSQVNQLDKKGKQRIMQLLQKSLAAPAAAQQSAAAPTDDVPINPATGKPLTEPERAAHQAAGGQFDGETGAPLPLGTKAVNPPSDFEKKVADLKAKRDAEKAAAQSAKGTAPATPATAPTTGQAAAQAQAAGQDPEQAALAAMQKNNPNLQKLTTRNRQPVKIAGKKKAVAPQQQVAGKEPKGNMVAESFSIFRKR